MPGRLTQALTIGDMLAFTSPNHTTTAMRLMLLSLCLWLAACGPTPAEPSVEQSHVTGNVPGQSAFNALLTRDLLAHLQSSDPQLTRVEFKLLRDAPTQSGVALPKYYAWVKAFAGTSLRQEGAVRVAAVDKTHFDVTHFFSKTQLQQGDQAKQVFPAALMPDIMRLAATP